MLLVFDILVQHLGLFVAFCVSVKMHKQLMNHFTPFAGINVDLVLEADDKAVAAADVHTANLARGLPVLRVENMVLC